MKDLSYTEERIKKYGIVAHKKHLQQIREAREKHLEKSRAISREWKSKHLEEVRAKSREWNQNHPDEVKARTREHSRKGGKRYEQKRKYQSTGLPHERQLVRVKHSSRYRPYKSIIAPDSQIHHEWIPETADYRGVALVEKDQHQHGYIDVIQILEGEITLLSEEEVRNGGGVEQCRT